MQKLWTGDDVKQARAKLGLSQAGLIEALGISISTLKRHEASESLDTTIALAVECLLRRRAAAHQVAVTPEERAERKFRERKRLLELKAADPDILALQAQASASAAALRAKLRGENVALQRAQVLATDSRRQIKAAIARNKKRASERQRIAALHEKLKILAAAGDAISYHGAIENAQTYAERNNLPNVIAYLERMEREIVPDNDPTLTLADEPV